MTDRMESARFKAWVKARGGDVMTRDGIYLSSMTRLWWECWQEAIRASPAGGETEAVVRYADLVRELHQAADEYDRGHGPLHAAAANAISHLETLFATPPAAAQSNGDAQWAIDIQLRCGACGTINSFEPNDELSTIRAQLEATRKALEEARDELVEHNMDYHHQTDRAILARINATLEGVRS